MPVCVPSCCRVYVLISTELNVAEEKQDILKHFKFECLRSEKSLQRYGFIVVFEFRKSNLFTEMENS